MLYFRDEEKRLLRQFYESESDRAMAVYGRKKKDRKNTSYDGIFSFVWGR